MHLIKYVLVVDLQLCLGSQSRETVMNTNWNFYRERKTSLENLNFRPRGRTWYSTPKKIFNGMRILNTCFSVKNMRGRKKRHRKDHDPNWIQKNVFRQIRMVAFKSTIWSIVSVIWWSRLLVLLRTNSLWWGAFEPAAKIHFQRFLDYLVTQLKL